MTLAKVLIIDDDQDYLSLLSEALENQFTTFTAPDIKSAEVVLAQHASIDIALVDENIGNESGSEWIKSFSTSPKAPKSFVLYSGMASEQAMLKGLECGADDFLSKPISLLTLSNKLEKLIQYHGKIQDFQAELKSKENVIHISMQQASKYGACMQLVSKLNNCFTLEQIRDNVFSFLYSMGLSGCIAFYPPQKPPLFFSSKNGCCSPVETEVMELLKTKPRLYRFGNRTIFNHPLVSILLLNLVPDSVETDIYIDAFASVIESVGARITFIEYRESLVDIQTQIKQAVLTTKNMVEISKHHQQEIMDDIVSKIGLSFHVLDLNEEQENYLTDLVHETLKKHSQDDINFLEVSRLLDDALLSVEKLENLDTEPVDNLVPDDDEDELF